MKKVRNFTEISRKIDVLLAENKMKALEQKLGSKTREDVWLECKTSTGQIYWFNSITSETAFENPNPKPKQSSPENPAETSVENVNENSPEKSKENSKEEVTLTESTQLAVEKQVDTFISNQPTDPPSSGDEKDNTKAVPVPEPPKSIKPPPPSEPKPPPPSTPKYRAKGSDSSDSSSTPSVTPSVTPNVTPSVTPSSSNDPIPSVGPIVCKGE